MAKILERQIENYLIAQMKKIGGEAYKWVSPNHRGVLDRIAIFPNGPVVFTEVKKPTGKLTPLQIRMVEKLLALGQNAEVVYTKTDVDMLIIKYS